MGDREDIAAHYGIPGLADRLQGSSRSELEAFAAAVVALGIQPEPKVNEGEIEALSRLDRKASKLSAADLLGVPASKDGGDDA